MNIRPSILQIAPYVGGEASLPGEDRIYRMASNESALGASPQAIAAFTQAGQDLHRYPDGQSKALRQALSDHFDLPIKRIVAGAGSDELIHLLVQAFAGPGDEVLYSRHGFLAYRIATLACGATPIDAPEKELRTDIEALLARVTPKTKLLLLTNPNNPTGSYLTKEEMRALRTRLPGHVLLVVDAAYAEYADQPDYESGLDLARTREDVVMLRTFSKIYGLASLRIGWAYCPSDVADALNRIRVPFNLSAPAQQAAIAALNDQAHVEKAKAHNHYWREWFRTRMNAIGLKAYPSQGNFVLVRFPDHPSANADQAANFLKERRVLARKMGAYHLPDCLRFTIAEEEVVKKAAALMEEFVQSMASQ